MIFFCRLIVYVFGMTVFVLNTETEVMWNIPSFLPIKAMAGLVLLGDMSFWK